MPRFVTVKTCCFCDNSLYLKIRDENLESIYFFFLLIQYTVFATFLPFFSNLLLLVIIQDSTYRFRAFHHSRA